MARWLGRLGLIPFVALAAAVVLDPHHRSLFATALAGYSFGILAFLLGSWWGLALVRRQPRALLASNLFFLLTFFAYLLLPTRAYLFAGAGIFLALLLVEHSHPLFRPQPAYYARLRIQLSFIAALAMLLCAALVP